MIESYPDDFIGIIDDEYEDREKRLIAQKVLECAERLKRALWLEDTWAMGRKNGE